MNALILAGMLALSPLQVCQGGGLEHRTLFVAEDDPQWDCRIDGDQYCGPNNSNGVQPGYYGLGDCTNLAGYNAGLQGIAFPGNPEYSQPVDGAQQAADALDRWADERFSPVHSVVPAHKMGGRIQ